MTNFLKDFQERRALLQDYYENNPVINDRDKIFFSKGPTSPLLSLVNTNDGKQASVINTMKYCCGLMSFDELRGTMQRKEKTHEKIFASSETPKDLNPREYGKGYILSPEIADIANKHNITSYNGYSPEAAPPSMTSTPSSSAKTVAQQHGYNGQAIDINGDGVADIPEITNSITPTPGGIKQEQALQAGH